jgi:signal transduction histidine kinase
MVIFLLTIGAGLLVGSVLLWSNTLSTVLIVVVLLQLISLIIYDRLNTARMRRSMRRFLEQINQGNYESENAQVIQKYDFVNLTDIQIELSEMVGKIRADYHEQKRYVENVSHELMTPIAIIRGKLELLIQSQGITKNDFKLINEILIKLDRLTRVNQALVLLSKIDYNHYSEKSTVSLHAILDETIDLFEDQIQVDQLTLRKDFRGDLMYEMNESLAYILIKNCIKNAVMHNIDKGYIHISDTENGQGIRIVNSGTVISATTDQLFERFQVAGEYEDSIGLGLSIMAKICEVSGIQLSYTHQEGVHTVEIIFP